MELVPIVEARTEGRWREAEKQNEGIYSNVFDKPNAMKFTSIAEARTEGRWLESGKAK